MRKIAKGIHREARYLNEKSAFIENVKAGTDLGVAKAAVSDLKERPKVGSKLVKAGTALVLSPDPFGDIPGGILIASGLAMKKYRDAASLSDIGANIKRALEQFR